MRSPTPIHAPMATSGKDPVVFLLGTTASGKTSLSIELCQRYGLEVVNCDSMQIWSGIDTLSAAPTPEERAGAPHHLFDILSCQDRHSLETWSVRQWEKEVETVVKAIRSRGHVPLFVGGTFYYAAYLISAGDADSVEASQSFSGDKRKGARDTHRGIRDTAPFPLHVLVLDADTYGTDVQCLGPLQAIGLKELLPAWVQCNSDINAALAAGLTTLSEGERESDRQTLRSLWCRMVSDVLADHVPYTSLSIKGAEGVPPIVSEAGYREAQMGTQAVVAGTLRYAKSQRKWAKRLARMVPSECVTSLSIAEGERERGMEAVRAFLATPPALMQAPPLTRVTCDSSAVTCECGLVVPKVNLDAHKQGRKHRLVMARDQKRARDMEQKELARLRGIEAQKQRERETAGEGA
ncbi:tRNA dimethylallyltransferase [Kipferlia bialata]|uniref:tRNA dimethylallyltransferase n=1 Tax=Kipferlia bialata TaxID=797122 RepID=A0A9K3CTA9_9EUKA|nr:tRNA dimethylallyltransferase [Kipferlia bialata]|eukprot:g3369.t1